MRYILREDVEIELPANWEQLIEEAVKFVGRQADAARLSAQAEGKSQGETEKAVQIATRDAITKRSIVWAQAREALCEVSHDKCWYCEKKQLRSDMPVDHFRPKGRVREAPKHPGYWWLAFDWNNLRLSCTFCNSRRRDVKTGRVGGKQDFFPILEPPPRQTSDTDSTDRPELLDPLVDKDTKLLTFLPNGYPSPTNLDEQHIDHRRAARSIQLYHLDHSALVRERKELAREIRDLVAFGQEAEQEDDVEKRRESKKRLIMLARQKAELSSSARVYLGAYRNLPWVQEIFERDL